MGTIPNFIGNPQGGPAGRGEGRSCFHGFKKNSNGNLLYTRITNGQVNLKDGNNNDLFIEKYIGDDDGNYSINTNGQLTYAYKDNPSKASKVLIGPAVTVTVGVDTIAGQSTGVFYVNGAERPELNITKGRTYIFDQSGSTNASYPGAGVYHPLMFSETENGELAGGGHYNSGVTFKLDGSQVNMGQYVSGFETATTRKVELTLGSSAPSTLYYWCHFHTGQGNKINVSEGTEY